MPSFNAGSVVEPLEYTLEPYAKRSGVIKEPTDRQLAGYLSGVKKLVKSFKGQLPDELISGSSDVGALMEAVDDLDPEVVLKFHDGLAGLFADLCSGEPSKEDLAALPIRIRAMFYAWLQQEVMAPEAAPGGGNAQVTTLRSRAAG